MKELRWDTVRTREAKCLHSEAPPFARPISEIQESQLSNVWARWKPRLEKAKAAGSKCFSSILMDWYYTSGAKCVHEHEGAWKSNTGNGYFGGFQADLNFQAAYGSEYLSRYGTANNWTPLQQIHMAYRGWLARGWSPWPNTARMCGLL